MPGNLRAIAFLGELGGGIRFDCCHRSLFHFEAIGLDAGRLRLNERPDSAKIDSAQKQAGRAARMWSGRLWRTLAAADINDPIFRRVSQIHMPIRAPKGGLRLPRPVALLVAIALIAALIHAPALMILVLVIPMLLITAMVAAPLLLPIATWLAGIHLTAAVISGIDREKRQNTYDLICALTKGRLSASWSFASGIAHRGGWFAPLRWGTLATLRAGMALLGGLSLFALLTAAFGQGSLGIEQARLFLLILLFLALYYSHIAHSLVTGLIVGLLASSFERSKPDATALGLFVYVAVSALPFLAAGLILVAFEWLVVEPAPMLRLTVEGGALMLVMALREAAVALLWRALEWRLEWGQPSGYRLYLGSEGLQSIA